MTGSQAQALWYEAPGPGLIRTSDLGLLAEHSARVRMLWSALSRGTERLVFSGRVPASEAERMRAPFQEGSFPHPVKYGYCAVGRVEAGPAEVIGREVFCLHPHQTLFDVPASALTPLPAAMPARRAIMAANMETALNALWDSGAGPGDRIVVIGAGVVGLLVAFIAARLPGADVTIVDIDASRAALAQALGLQFSTPGSLPDSARDADVVFHASAASEGLALALACAGLEARIVELSWYGDAVVPVPLGGAFHSRRLSVISSQVGQVSPGRRARWTYARRLAKALELLQDECLDALITEEVAFDDLPEALPRILSPGAAGLVTAVSYSAP